MLSRGGEGAAIERAEFRLQEKRVEPMHAPKRLGQLACHHVCANCWEVHFVSSSRWEYVGVDGRHRETQTAGVGKGRSTHESLGVFGSRWESLGVVDVMGVYSPITCNYVQH